MQGPFKTGFTVYENLSGQAWRDKEIREERQACRKNGRENAGNGYKRERKVKYFTLSTPQPLFWSRTSHLRPWIHF